MPWASFFVKYTTLLPAKSLQSCLTLCDPMDCSLPGSPVPGILQARTLEWLAISFSNAWKWKVKVKSLSRVRLLVTPWTAAYQAPPSIGFSSKSTGVGCHCLLPILPYQQLNNNKEKGENRGNNLFSWKWWRINIINIPLTFTLPNYQHAYYKNKEIEWDVNLNSLLDFYLL